METQEKLVTEVYSMKSQVTLLNSYFERCSATQINQSSSLKEELTEIISSFKIINNKIESLETSFNQSKKNELTTKIFCSRENLLDNKAKIETEINKFSFAKPTLTSGIRSSVSSFTSNETNKEEVILNLDENGFLRESSGRIILDDEGNPIHLATEHILYLKQNKLLEDIPS